MDFGFSETQEMFRDSIRDFLKKECPKDKVRKLDEDERGYDPEMWHKMAELGWMGIVFPEEYGGANGEFLDLMILMEEMGKNLCPGPFFPTVALCALPMLEFGTHEQKAKFLPEIAKGNAIWTLALLEHSAAYEASGIKLAATLEGEEYVLEGTKLFVPYAHVANHFLVAARTGEGERSEEGITIFIVDSNPSIKVEVIPVTAHDKQCEVKFDKVRVPKNNILGEINQGWKIVDFLIQRATILKCAEMSGGAQAVLELSSAYAKERVQFGKPIGSFQALQHRLADMLTDVEGLRYLVHEAAWKINVGSPSNLLVHMAKVKVNEVYQRTCIEGIRIHGAIGFTREHDIGLYHRCTKAAEFALGDSDFHREKIALGLAERGKIS